MRSERSRTEGMAVSNIHNKRRMLGSCYKRRFTAFSTLSQSKNVSIKQLNWKEIPCFPDYKFKFVVSNLADFTLNFVIDRFVLLKVFVR